ncbi:MAG: hypothetical protein L0Y56_02205 [Nitrospira sp.]|nr:hypothetical protein [Nitrospira sp.]
MVDLLPSTFAYEQFFGTIVNDRYLQLQGFVPDSDSWVITRGDYDATDNETWANGVCASHRGEAAGNLGWLTLDYGSHGNFSTTGFDLLFPPKKGCRSMADLKKG